MTQSNNLCFLLHKSDRDYRLYMTYVLNGKTLTSLQIKYERHYKDSSLKTIIRHFIDLSLKSIKGIVKIYRLSL